MTYLILPNGPTPPAPPPHPPFIQDLRVLTIFYRWKKVWKSEVRKVVDKTFDACKSAGVKKLRVRAAESYSGLSENKILEITKKHVKYRNLMSSF